MNNRALLSVVAVCFAVAACDTKKDEPPKPKTAQAVVPLPPEAPKAAAASANQDAASVQLAQAADKKAGAANPGAAKKDACKNGNHCDIDVAVDEATCKVTKTPDPLYVARGQPEKVKFKGTAGVSVLKVEFLDKNAPFKCAPQGSHVECDDANNGPDFKQWNYKVTAKGSGGKTCSIDPMIVNGADDQN